MTRTIALAAAMLLAMGAPVEAAGRWHGPVSASWYGPIRLTWYGGRQYYGNRTACGQRYTRHIVGVATWLPLRCGTLIELRWHGRRVVAPVIDRMPRHPWVVFDASAHVACELLNGPRLQGVCWTRGDVYWRVVR